MQFAAADAKEANSMPNPPDALTIEEHFFADDGRVPDTNHYGGSCLEEISLIVGGRRR